MRDDYYYNVGEVASGCQLLADTFPGQASLFKLPLTLPDGTVLGHPTHGGTPIIGLSVGNAAIQNKPVLMIVGGFHGDEWGSCEIIVNLASTLLQCPAAGLDYGNQIHFPLANVQAILDGLELVLLPLANPDGRFFSQDSGEPWRKNRRQMRGPNAIGVDPNRNFDHFFGLGDKNESSPFFRGPQAGLEPETKNICELVAHHDPSWFVDLHSGARCVLYPWSVGPQHALPLAGADLHDHLALAGVYAGATGGVSGKPVQAVAGFNFIDTSGTSHDWVYSRARPNGRSPTLAFAIEWSTEQVPSWSTMADIVREVDAGLVAMCLHALSNPR